MSTKQIKITGMHCASCSALVEKMVSLKNGVEKASVNLATETLTVSFNEKIITENEIFSVIRDCGFDVAQDPSSDVKKKELNIYKRRFISSLVFAGCLLYLAMAHLTGNVLFYPFFADPEKFPVLYSWILFLLLIPIIFINRHYYTKGFPSLFKGHPDMNSLIAVSTSAAIAYSIFNLIQITMGNYLLTASLYFESAAMIPALVTTGKYIEAKAKNKTDDAIKALINLSPKNGTIIKDNTEKEIPVSEIQVGDILLCRAGDAFCVDGVIIEGTASVDEAMITGESLPVQKNIGDEVIGATINKNSSVKYKATKVGKDTFLSNIIQMVQDAQGSKAPIARYADKISSKFVPLVLIIAAVMFFLWTFAAGKEVYFSLTIFLSVLVVACPCAMGLATPMAIMIGTGRGAKEGILFKNAESLENTCNVKVVAFDKTGTLTKGSPKVSGMIGEGNFLCLAASLEKHSNHPLAKAILNHANQHNISLKKCTDTIEYSGIGISGKIDNDIILAGNQTFIFEQGCKTASFYTEQATRFSNAGKTPVYVAKNNETIGIIGIYDEIKTDADDTITELKKMYIHSVMLTGDNEKTALSVANELGIEEVIPKIKPGEKAKKIHYCMEKYGITIMVGDGINDAPALKTANIGISLETGTDVAKSSADVILIGKKIFGVITAIKISKMTIKNIKQNLFWAFIYNIAGISIACGLLYLFGGPLLNPMIAALAMCLSNIFVVGNALRLYKIKIK